MKNKVTAGTVWQVKNSPCGEEIYGLEKSFAQGKGSRGTNSLGNKIPLTPAHMKGGVTELDVEFQISMNLCRGKPREYDARNN